MERKHEGEKSDFEECMEWISHQKDEIQGAKYGRNETSVQEAIKIQEQTKANIESFQDRVNGVIRQLDDDSEEKRLSDAYAGLLELSRKKLSCLKTMLEITSLEHAIANMGSEFDTNALHMTKKTTDIAEGEQRISGFMSPASQDCVFAARDNWNWITKLVQCVQIHLTNAAQYQQFFHEVEETEVWMSADIQKLHDMFDITVLKGEYHDAQRLLDELQELLIALRQWEAKITFMWDSASKVVPVHLRVEGVPEPTPARSLADYETEKISTREGEDVLLLKNSNPRVWTVRNNRGQEGDVPAVTCLIPGPYKEAVEAATRMRLKLLQAWTGVLKKIGMRLIVFMLKVFKSNYNDEEVGVMRGIRLMEKRDLLRILDFIEDTLSVHWGNHKAFQDLQERILALRMILEDAGEHPLQDEKASSALVVQIGLLEQLMDKYKDMWADWEMFKCVVESSNSPELMLIVDKWEQLKFVNKEYFTKYWQMELDAEEGAGKRPVGQSSVSESSVADGSFEMSYGDSSMDDETMWETVDGVQVRKNITGETTVDSTVTPSLAPAVRGSPSSDAGFHSDLSTATVPGHEEDFNEQVTTLPDGSTVVRRVTETTRTTRTGYGRDRPDATGAHEVTTTTRPGAGGEQFVTAEQSTNVYQARPDQYMGGDVTTGGGGTFVQRVTTTRTGQENGDVGLRGDGGLSMERTVTRTSRLGPGSGEDNETFSSGGEGTDIRRMMTTTTRTTGYGDAGRTERPVGDSGSGYQRFSESTTRTHTGPGDMQQEMYSSGGEGSNIQTIVSSTTRGGARGPLQTAGAGMYPTQESVETMGEGANFERIRQDEVTMVRSAALGSANVSAAGGAGGFRIAGSGGSGMYGEGFLEEQIESISEGQLGAAGRGFRAQLSSEGGEFGMAHELRVAETESLEKASREETQHIQIISVRDPRDNSDISFDDAKAVGIINLGEGMYVNPDSGETLPISAAMTQGLIKMGFTRTQRSREEKSTIGIITVKTIKHAARNYDIKTVTDTVTGEKLSQQQAEDRGILDNQHGIFTDKLQRREMLIAEAVEKGLVEAELAGGEEEPEVISTTYAVRAVVDLGQKKQITFAQAVRRGIIDKENGAFKNTRTNEMMYVGDAIAKGFLKARKIEAKHSLDVDPANKMVIDKTEKLRKRLLQPLGVISAFRRAAQAAQSLKK